MSTQTRWPSIVTRRRFVGSDVRHLPVAAERNRCERPSSMWAVKAASQRYRRFQLPLMKRQDPDGMPIVTAMETTPLSETEAPVVPLVEEEAARPEPQREVPNLVDTSVLQLSQIQPVLIENRDSMMCPTRSHSPTVELHRREPAVHNLSQALGDSSLSDAPAEGDADAVLHQEDKEDGQVPHQEDNQTIEVSNSNDHQASDNEKNENTLSSLIKSFSKWAIDSPSRVAWLPIDELKKIALEPARHETMVNCRVYRKPYGDKERKPVYQMYMERSDGKLMILLSARKRRKCYAHRYVLTVNHNDLRRYSNGYLGKLRSNLIGTSFTLYDDGFQPGALIVCPGAPLRQELMAVFYDRNILGMRGPRCMSAMLPALDSNRKPTVIAPKTYQETLVSRWEHGLLKAMIPVHNKKPMWNESTQSYVLNFHGRVTRPSVKNFQLVHESNAEYIMMQFGKVDDNVFTLDYRYPLNALQAFAIAISSFDDKLACE